MKKSLLLITVLLLIITSCEAVFIENISNKTVILISPSDKVEVPTGEVNFNWNIIEDADVYQLQIATPNFETPTQILSDTITDKIIFKKELVIGEYEWRVKAKNSEYETSYSTNIFTVK
ncbi:hypothetical protein H0I31_02200 [Tenacibaculum sp. AHE15PA]|uniref:hypothetical protein n=1 Tax=unclassified Tenacibaculum TaxID=2635139 RepID=UPI001C4EC65B|nr:MULTISPECIES: hypothetical protein [unclassified Tenacibaculum]QXP72534.1 hypothetical protein H0I30_07455 [Tenacibaculum sp. AHE14PA]QXP76449.1 hypothetical protein H0I31_02200 [Tenacibaculum sp. AHE15PA]